MYRLTDWPLLIRDRPTEARRLIRTALREARGSVTGAAALLWLGTRTLHRYVTDLELREELEEIRRRAGWVEKKGKD
jgi:transcriptional regulator with GAF, ATPase, and Fis domain